MIFENQDGYMVNSDRIKKWGVSNWSGQWTVTAFYTDPSGREILYTGDKEQCRNWLKKLVTEINNFQKGI